MIVLHPELVCYLSMTPAPVSDPCPMPLPLPIGISVEAACKSISSDLLDKFNFALVWGTSTKYNPQRVGMAHMLHDEDVLQVFGIPHCHPTIRRGGYENTSTP